MTFYIPEFWCGVIATIFLEAAAVISAAVVSMKNDNKKKKEKAQDKAGGAVGTYDDRGEWRESK